MLTPMNTAIRIPAMTREAFFAWAEAQDEPYEFDGFQPVAMTGGSIDNRRMNGNLIATLRHQLAGSGCEALGPDAGIATLGDAVRYPDGLVTCANLDGASRLVSGDVIVFEVLSPTSGRTDGIDELREYRAVPSIRRYIILEHASAVLQVFARDQADTDWTATALTAEDTLDLPEIGIAIPVAELSRNIDLSPQPSVT